MIFSTLKIAFGMLAGALTFLILAWPAQSAGEVVFGPEIARNWRVIEILGGEPIEGIEVTLEIGANGTLTGNGGCNHFTGKIIKNGDRVTVSPIAATNRYCIGPITEQERRLFKRLEDIDIVKVGEDGFLLMTADKTPIVKAQPRQEP